jgi:hypothetical protein
MSAGKCWKERDISILKTVSTGIPTRYQVPLFLMLMLMHL